MADRETVGLYSQDNKFPLQESKAQKVLLLAMAKYYTKAQWTGEQVAQFLEAVIALIDANRGDRPSGGLESFLGLIYGDQKLPIDLIEALLLECLRENVYRELIQHRLEDLVKAMRESGDLERPYRDWLSIFFQGQADEKEAKKKANQERVTRTPSWPSAQKEDTDSDLV